MKPTIAVLAALLTCMCAEMLGQSPPPEPWRLVGACPFECCQLGEWRAQGRVVARVSPNRTARVAFIIARGDSVTAQAGEVRSAHLGRVVVRTPFSVPDESGTTFRPSVGDTVYITSYDGEGRWSVWHQGRSYSLQAFWPEQVGKRLSAAPGQLLYPPNGTWWVRLVNRRGQVGWIEGGHITVLGLEGASPSFDGADACG